MARLEGKCAVITGATSGIGEASAIMFAKEGAQVVCTGRNQEKGDALLYGQNDVSTLRIDFIQTDGADQRAPAADGDSDAAGKGGIRKN